MKTLLPLIVTLGLSLSLPSIAQDAIDRDQLIEALMQAPDEAALNQAITAGKQAGLAEQMFLEARFMLLVNQNDIPALAALAPALEAQLPHYTTDTTMIFGVKEDFHSIIHYTKALAALQENDSSGFKKHITEAYWLSPAHGRQFAPHINAVRLKEAMSKITLDLSRSFQNQKKSDQHLTLKKIAGDSPIMLIHFWSPWVQTSLLAMPEFNAVAKVLSDHQIPVASFLLAGTADSRKDADDFITKQNKKDAQHGHWLVDTDDASLASTLRVATFPAVILVNNAGRILFNGDPADAALWQQLAEIKPKIKPPTIKPLLPDDLLEKIAPATQQDE